MKLVEDAIIIDRDIVRLTEELAAIKKKLVAEALKRKADQAETEGRGWSVVLEGAAGNVARVTQPGRKLKAAIDAEKPAGALLMTRVGRFKDELFTPRLTYVPVENFRERVRELFAQATAGTIIKACESPAAVSVSFETKDTGE